MAKFTGLYITGKTPAKVPYWIGMQAAMLFPVIECLSIRQSRMLMKTALKMLDWRDGLGSEAVRAKWTTKVHGEGWQGHWIPFQDQLNTVTSIKGSPKATHTPSDTPVGAGCDIIVLSIHGGGYIDGHALMFLNYFRNWMKSVQKNQNLKIGILSIEYGLSPENPYPYAMNEIISAYRDLVKIHGVDSKRIVLLGDSAGGNICLGTSLKLRDAFSELGSPAGHILICPWVRSKDPIKSSMYDVVSSIGCEIYAEAYTQNDPAIVMCPYTSPYSAPTLAGLPPMLIFIGGVEILRPSIEKFVVKAQADGVNVKAVVGEGRAHNYMLMKDLSTKEDRVEAHQAMGEFVLQAHQRFTQMSLSH
ncbi:hypothetical protein BG011_000431 [Mortierella polycephala]|uniref:Alpha/beta hydrolase fold-3 domain-containing protein n=1 Tax=Mortierella polycephala TaxID=41804 RepID=A0A9P6Q8X4_9FUNG|nr:hypothetical protein BG011_000431 [Mortierella polycephala]